MLFWNSVNVYALVFKRRIAGGIEWNVTVSRESEYKLALIVTIEL